MKTKHLFYFLLISLVPTLVWSTPVSGVGGVGIGAGERNTASNVGSEGVGVFLQKTDVDLEFLGFSTGSIRISVSTNSNNVIIYEVNESSLTLNNMAGAVSGSQIDLTGVSLGTWTVHVSSIEYSNFGESLQQPIVTIQNTGTGEDSNLKLESLAAGSPGLMFWQSVTPRGKISYDNTAGAIEIHNFASCANVPIRFEDNGNLAVHSCVSGAQQILLFARGAVQLTNFTTNLPGSAENIVLKSTDGVSGTAQLLVENEDLEITQLSGAAIFPLGITISGSTLSVNTVSYQFPSADGTSLQVLHTDGAGNLSWDTDDTTVGGAILVDTQTFSGQNTFEADVVVSSNVTITGGILTVGSTPVPAILEIVVPISAASFSGTVSSGIPPIETAEIPASGVNYDYAILKSTDDGSGNQNFFEFSYSPPPGWDEGTVTFEVVWTATGTPSGGVAFNLQALARSNDDPLDTVYGSTITVTDTFIADEDVHITATSGAVTIGGTPVEGDYVTWRGSREVANGSDTMDAHALVLEYRIRFTRDSYGD